MTQEETASEWEGKAWEEIAVEVEVLVRALRILIVIRHDEREH